MPSPRRLEQFSSRDGFTVIDLSSIVVSHSSEQGVRSAYFHAAGQDYPQRTMGYAPALMAMARETAVLDLFGEPSDVDDATDELFASLHEIGLGQLWTIDDNDVLRWAWACIGAMPSHAAGPFTLFNRTAEVVFDRYSDWFAETPTTGSVALTANPTGFDIDNAGFGRASRVVFRLRANATSGFGNNPTLTNARGEQSITVNLDAASADAEIRIRNEDRVVEQSTDDGTNYTDAFDLVTLGDTQAHLMEIHRGINPMSYSQDSGTPDAVLEWEYYETFKS